MNSERHYFEIENSNRRLVGVTQMELDEIIRAHPDVTMKDVRVWRRHDITSGRIAPMQCDTLRSGHDECPYFHCSICGHCINRYQQDDAERIVTHWCHRDCIEQEGGALNVEARFL